MPFQTTVNALQAPAAPGDPVSAADPRATLLSNQFNNQIGIVAGPNGATMARFAWLDTATYSQVSNSGAGAPNGFIMRSMGALITNYLGEATMLIPAGFAVAAYNEGSFWVVNSGTNLATPGMKAYANNSTGVATFAATGAPTSLATSTASTIAAGTASVPTSTITNNVFTTGGAVTGLFPVGSVLSGTGVAPGTVITAQLTGTALGAGTYSVSPQDQTVASTTISGTYGLLTIGGTVVSGYAIGQTVTGAGIAAGTILTALGTGVGGAGTYYVNPTQVIGVAQAINANSNTETGWFCRSVAAAGALAMISSRTMG